MQDPHRIQWKAKNLPLSGPDFPVDEREVLKVLGEQMSIPVVDLNEIQIDFELLRATPAHLIRKGLIPFRRIADTLRVATADPYDITGFDDLRIHTGLKIEPCLAIRSEIERVIAAHFGASP